MTKEYVYQTADGSTNVCVGDTVEMEGSPALVHEVIPGFGIRIDTLGAGMKMRIPFTFEEMTMRGVHIVDRAQEAKSNS